MPRRDGYGEKRCRQADSDERPNTEDLPNEHRPRAKSRIREKSGQNQKVVYVGRREDDNRNRDEGQRSHATIVLPRSVTALLCLLKPPTVAGGTSQIQSNYQHPGRAFPSRRAVQAASRPAVTTTV